MIKFSIRFDRTPAKRVQEILKARYPGVQIFPSSLNQDRKTRIESALDSIDIKPASKRSMLHSFTRAVEHRGDTFAAEIKIEHTRFMFEASEIGLMVWIENDRKELSEALLEDLAADLRSKLVECPLTEVDMLG